MKKLGKYLIYDEYAENLKESERYFRFYARENYLKLIKVKTLETAHYQDGLYRGYFIRIKNYSR